MGHLHSPVTMSLIVKINQKSKGCWNWLMEIMTVVAAFIMRYVWPKGRRTSHIVSVDYKNDVVYIHTFPRRFTKKVVNLSPFDVKLETWCRMNQIPHQIIETSKFSPKEGQIPWIWYNNVIMADSSAIIDFLSKEFKRGDDLSVVQKGVERSVSRMLDECFSQLYFFFRYFRMRHEFSKCFRVTTAPPFLQSYIAKQIGKGLAKKAQMNGFGRYGDDHVINLGKKDLKALDSVLGDKSFMLGEFPTTLDATVFGHLSQIVYPDLEYPWKDYIKNECPRLLEFCSRIKNRYWPDWDQLVEHDTFA